MPLLSKKKWNCSGVTIQNGKNSNMDRILLEFRGASMLLAVVCDGVGSLKDGAFAAQYCTDELRKWLFSEKEYGLGLSLRDRILRINRELVDIAYQRNLMTATTLSALLLLDEQYSLVHIGDSRIYHLRDSNLTLLTDDDISESGKLIGCIGRWNEIFLHYEEGENAGTFLLCTDGLYKTLREDTMVKRLTRASGFTLRWRIRQMIKDAIRQGAKDNISAIIISEK